MRRTAPEPVSDDPFCLDEIEAALDQDPRTPTAIGVVTGLSAEEDAGRLIALQLDPSARFCIWCETFESVDDISNPDSEEWSCSSCGGILYSVGTKPIRKHRYVK